jgi:hypothetical protein
MEFSERGKERLPGKEGLLGRQNLEGREGLQNVLDVSSVAQSRLSVLLERPECLRWEHRKELRALVGPEWRQLGADIERYMNWSARATSLLRAIDQTPQSALADSEWTALLREAHKAVDETHTAVHRINFSMNVHVPARSILSLEDADTERILGPEGRSTRRILGVEGGSTRRIPDPEGRSTRRIPGP